MVLELFGFGHFVSIFGQNQRKFRKFVAYLLTSTQWPVLELVYSWGKSSTVAYKGVAFKKNRVKLVVHETWDNRVKLVVHETWDNRVELVVHETWDNRVKLVVHETWDNRVKLVVHETWDNRVKLVVHETWDNRVKLVVHETWDNFSNFLTYWNTGNEP